MDRRDLLKALAAVSCATAVGACDDKDRKDEKHGRKNSIVEVHLEGAFALVIQKNKGNSLLAFSPRPKAGDVQHEFHFNGYRKAQGGAKTLNFTLSPEGLERERKSPVINPGLNDFFFQTEKWRVGDSLVTIELPAPDKISFSGHRNQFAFKSNPNHPVWMASNHVLKYELHGAAARLDCNDGNIKCLPSEDSYPGVTRFFFEIGPARSLDYNQSHAHAASFFNYMLQQSFPELVAKFSLDERYAGAAQAQAPHLAPAVLPLQPHASFERRVSYIVECELGGPLVGTGTSPTA